jgi:hypothetical protein
MTHLLLYRMVAKDEVYRECAELPLIPLRCLRQALSCLGGFAPRTLLGTHRVQALPQARPLARTCPAQAAQNPRCGESWAGEAPAPRWMN